MPSEINVPIIEEGGGGLLKLLRLYYTDYNSSGDVLQTGNFGLFERYGSYDNIGYWTIQYGTNQVFYPDGWAYSTYYAEYIDEVSNYYNTETFNVYKQECDQSMIDSDFGGLIAIQD